MPFFRDFALRCSECGHRNKPHKSPRKAIEIVLRGHTPPCRGCGRNLRPQLSDRPLVRRVRQELQAQGIAVVC